MIYLIDFCAWNKRDHLSVTRVVYVAAVVRSELGSKKGDVPARIVFSFYTYRTTPSGCSARC